MNFSMLVTTLNLVLLLVCYACATNVETVENLNSVWVEFTVNTENVVHETDDRFLSVTLDTTLIRHRWKNFNMSSTKLHTLSRGLAPAYLRVGGTSADFLIFDSSQKNEPHFSDSNSQMNNEWLDSYGRIAAPKNITNFTMTAWDWDSINTFSSSVGWQLIFDLNVLLRCNQHWDSSNAEELFLYTVKRGYSPYFELGNEPDAFLHALNRTLSSTQLAKDFRRLARLLKLFPELKISIVGPDLTRPKKKSLRYLGRFLKRAKTVIDAVTVHHYYISGETAHEENFTDYKILDYLPKQLSLFHQVIHREAPKKSLWLGETSSCWGGGARNLSDRYLAGFMWLDKLGIAARMGLDVVIRQSFYNGHYALLDDNLNPRPDYWLSLLYKVLVGRKVLDVSLSLPDEKVRVYAHCTSNRSEYPTGAITLYVLNLHKGTAVLNFTSFRTMRIHEYALTPHGGQGITATDVDLNGIKLQLTDDQTLPTLVPRILEAGHPAKLRGKTFAFYVIPNVDSSACMSNNIS